MNKPPTRSWVTHGPADFSLATEPAPTQAKALTEDARSTPDEFSLSIDCGNAAFGDEADFEDDDMQGLWSARTREIASILDAIATKLQGGSRGGPCIDSNGNTVGKWSFK